MVALGPGADLGYPGSYSSIYNLLASARGGFVPRHTHPSLTTLLRHVEPEVSCPRGCRFSPGPSVTLPEPVNHLPVMSSGPVPTSATPSQTWEQRAATVGGPVLTNCKSPCAVWVDAFGRGGVVPGGEVPRVPRGISMYG